MNDPGMRYGEDQPEGAPFGSQDVLTDRLMAQSYQREDERWSRASQFRDWIILVVIAVLHLAWMLLVFLVEPGIR